MWLLATYVAPTSMPYARHMEIIITGKSALMLYRQMRAGTLRLSTKVIPMASVSWEKLDGKRLGQLEIPALELSGLFTVDRPLDLRVRNTGDRARLETVICHSTTKPLPGGSIVELSAPWRTRELLPSVTNCRVLMDSIPLVILDMAGQILALVNRGKMSNDDAVMRLAALICEFCGTYARHYLDPNRGETTFELGPATTVSEISAFLAQVHGIPGINLARAAVRLATDGLASPMELVVYASMAFPPRMGGLHIRNVRVNEPLDLSAVPAGTLAHKRLTPDLRVGDDPVGIEYNGKEHLEKYRVREDKNRAQDYAKLGFFQYPLMYEDIETVEALDKTLRSLVDLLTEYEGTTFRKRTMGILRDRGYRAARLRMLNTYLWRTDASAKS